MKKIIGTCVFFLFFLSKTMVFSQQILQTLPEFKYKVNHKFSDEWQYLSSDLYLFNADKFNLLLNDFIRGSKRERRKIWRRKKDEEFIEHLFITANIKDLKFFGGDLTYPIYNFKILKDDNNYRYKTKISNNVEVLRIIDNLPLSTTNDYIEAVIEGEAITSKNSKRMFSVVAKQLMNISVITNPSKAILSLVGEFGKFMESKTEGKQYKFNSTIRLYEGKDFNQKLHSINIYVFAPSGIKKTNMNCDPLISLLDTVKNPEINRKTLSELVYYQKYPYMIIVNYKSKYITPPVIGDEINFETIEKRKQKIKEDYSKDLLKKSLYIQEMKLISFLEIFANLKLNINTYKLNYENELTKDFSKNFFVILQEFRKLKNTFENRQKEFKRSSVFKNEFKSKYKSIILNAELYFESNIDLKNIKTLVNTLFEFEKNPRMRLDSLKREDYLRKLYAVKLPKTERNSDELRSVDKIVRRLELEQYSYFYDRSVNSLKKLEANDKTLPQTELLKTKIKTTNCKYCRKKVEDALQEYGRKYEEYQKEKLKESSKATIKEAKNKLFEFSIKEECIKDKLKKLYPETEEQPFHIEIFRDEFKSLVNKRKKLHSLIRQKNEGKSLNEIKADLEQMKELSESITEGYKNICTKVKKLCNCED